MLTDTKLLTGEEIARLPEYVNAMANSAGGLIRFEDGREIPVSPLAWHKRPVKLNGQVLRRYEGQNIISSQWAVSVMATDSQTSSGDDFPADSSCLDRKSLAEFRKTVLSLNPEYTQFSRNEFFRRTGVFSGRHITFAGALMFGSELRVRAELTHHELHAEIEAHNIWRALREILPRLARKLSPKSSFAMHNIFTSTLLNADYSLDSNINITILAEPPRIIIDAPGIVRPSVRNSRLARIFELAGFSVQPLIAEQDMLNFRSASTIPIEGSCAIIL